MRNVFYFRYINCIGGIEQFFSYLSNKYRDWDITIIYKSGDPQQLARLRKYVRVIKFTGQKIECDKVFYCFNTEIRDFVVAKQSAIILHGDYAAMVEQGQLDKDCAIFNEQFDEYYGVSQVVCDSWAKITGKPCKLVYNPFIKEPCKKILRLVYCGRLTDEKGGDLATQLMSRMDELHIEYQLYVYSNRASIGGNNVIYLSTRLDVCQLLNTQNYDYILVPSKNEGYCYSLVQALANGLPAVTTPCPVFAELGVDDTNSITLAFDGSNIDEVIYQMLNKRLKFKYTPREDTWDKVLLPGKTTYKYQTVSVIVAQKYYDIDTDTHKSVGEIFDVTYERANELIDAGVVKLQKES